MRLAGKDMTTSVQPKVCTRLTVAVLIAFFAGLLFAQPALAAAPVGINLAGLGYYGSEFPFKDMGKLKDVRDLGNGRNTSFVMWDIEGNYPTGQYVILYDGTGTIDSWSSNISVVSQQPGRIVINVTNGGATGISFNWDQTISNIRIILPGFESTYQTDRWHPTFLNKWAGFPVYRFMDWGITNGNPIVNWSDRALLTDESWGADSADNRGIPYELWIELCNRQMAEPWICVPHQATDDFVTQMATMFQNNLDPSLNIWVEFSNECWNTVFSQTWYCDDQGQAEGLDPDRYAAGRKWYSKRAVQIFDIFNNIMGSGRVNTVLSGQTGNTFINDIILGYNNAYLKTDYFGVAPYFGNEYGTDELAGQVQSWTMTQLFNHLQTSTDYGLPANRTWQMEADQALASSYGVGLTAYEAGQHLVGVGTWAENQSLTNLFTGANRDIRMNDVYDTYLQNWDQVTQGQGLICMFASCGKYIKWGSWGLTEWQEQFDSPKYTSVMDFMGGGGSPPPTPTGLTATPGNGQVALSWNASTGATSYNVKRSTTSGSGYSTIASPTTTSYTNTGLTNSITYYYVVSAVNSNGQSANSSQVSATPSSGGGSLPSGWTAADIGSPSPAGSTSHSSGNWTVNGGGADIWGSSDQFHYGYRDASGDTTVVARVDTLQNTNGWAKAGVMIRNGTAANAQFALAVVTPSNGVAFQWRSSTGGSASHSGTTGITAPRWVRIVRSGNSFTASHSSNGSSWTTIGSPVTISMPTSTKAGLCVTSHANGTLCTATMSNVSVTTGGGGSPPAAPTNLSATAGDGQVGLSWTGSSGATSYNVKRSTTSGGPYSTIASPTSTSYTNTGLTNGTTYYYVVTAVNSNGESGNSNQASATPVGGQVAAPSFSPVAGTYSSTQSVTISTGTSGASIRYTTDGSNPTSTSGTLYSGPVTISVTTTLKAIAFKSGMTDSSVTSGTYTISTGGTGAFQQDSGSQGIVSMEAENFDANVSQGGHDWVLRTDSAGFSGTGLMRSEPDSGALNNTGFETNSPRLDFQVNFVKTGTHYIWLRTWKTGGSDDSLHLGLNGAAQANSDRIQAAGSNGTWAWSRTTMDSTTATINVASTGVQTVNVWMREDGLRIDKIVLTTDAAFTPSGTGPAESPRGGGGGGTTYTWNSYDVVTQNATPKARVTSTTGSQTADLELYVSSGLTSVTLGSNLSSWNAGIHPEASEGNEVQQYWHTNEYPYVGKSTTARNSTLFDLTLHPPQANQLTMVAFVAPVSGQYSVSQIGVRRISAGGATVILKTFNPSASQISSLTATSNQQWVNDSNTYSLGALSAGQKVYFGVDRDGDYGWDATEITWRITATVP